MKTSRTPDLYFPESCKTVGRITLSRDCEIIDLSDDIKSCPGASSGRTLLFEAMSQRDAETIRKMCSDSTGQVEVMLTRIHLRDYRYALATGGNRGGVTLFLLKSYRDLVGLGESASKYLPNCFPELQGTFPQLFSSKDVLDSSDAVALLRLISARLSKSGELISSSVIFSQRNTSSDESVKGSLVPSGPLAQIFTTLLSILDSASSDGSISISTSVFSGSLEITLSTRCAIHCSIFGEVSDVLLLADHLKGTLPRLSLASFTAAESEIRLSADISPEGDVSFYLSHVPEVSPPLEFKFDDPTARANLLVDTVLRLLSHGHFISE